MIYTVLTKIMRRQGSIQQSNTQKKCHCRVYGVRLYKTAFRLQRNRDECTQRMFYEVEIICFSLFLMTQQTVMMQVSLAGQIVYSTAVSDVNDKLMDFCCFLLFSAISMILLKKMCQFCATWAKSSAFCISIQHLQLMQL